MKYRKFGKTGISISTLGFGSMRLPKIEIRGKTVYNHDKSIQIIRRAFELGVNFIDTAPSYCDKESEIIVGEALKGWRDKIYLSTKNPIGDGSKIFFMDLLESSLKKLDTGHIDFYHMWSMDWDVFRQKVDVKDGLMIQAVKAMEEGLIKHISFSSHDMPENIIKLVDTGCFETMLCQYNLLDRSNEEVIAHARKKGLGVAIMGPVCGGFLAYPSKIIRKILPGGAKSSAETALRFVISNHDVTCALSGMNSIAMVEENARTASNESQLSEKELAAISAAMEKYKRLAELYCTGCNYCMPCPSGVNIPLNFLLMNYFRIYGFIEYARDEYEKIGTAAQPNGKRADECIGCGLCETKCPQRIRIRGQLKDVAAALSRSR